MPEQSDNTHPLYGAPKQSGHPLSDAPKNEPQEEKGHRVPIPQATKTPIVTYALIVINVAIFGLRYIMPDLALEIIYAGFIEPDAILRDGQLYRLFTGMFLHFDEAHMLFNGIALYYVGSHLERMFGHLRFLIIYILGGLAGSIFPLLFGGGGLGASGAVFAIWGAEVIFLYRNLRIFGDSGRARLRSTVSLMIFNFAFGFTANALANVADSAVRIGNAAHFGGLLGGVILAWFIAPIFGVKQVERSEENPVGVVITQGNDLQSHRLEILGFIAGLVVLFLIASVLRL